MGAEDACRGEASGAAEGLSPGVHVYERSAAPEDDTTPADRVLLDFTSNMTGEQRIALARRGTGESAGSIDTLANYEEATPRQGNPILTVRSNVGAKLGYLNDHTALAELRQDCLKRGGSGNRNTQQNHFERRETNDMRDDALNPQDPAYKRNIRIGFGSPAPLHRLGHSMSRVCGDRSAWLL